ncbi:MAG: glycosyltransferase [Ignavibacteria bacterium]|nr:glycosyltransferase [Ignavibacteria bacterium]
MIYLPILLITIYFMTHMILMYGIIINRKKKNSSVYLPDVSLIVCAKDEEKNIEKCILSILKLNYPRDKTEVILVNDRSEDATGEIMKKYVSLNSNLRYVEITEEGKKLKGKANALNEALKTARGEIIFTTDADIEVNPKWITEMLKYYDEKTGVVSSYSVIRPESLFSSLQSVDWLYLLSIACGGDGIGVPISCVGNNMSYRKTAYDKVGGYEGIKFSVTEDFMLLQKIHKDAGYKTKFPLNKSTMNVTAPCSNLTELFRQKKRWAAGGLGEFNYGIIIGLLLWLSGAVILTGWIYLDINLWLGFILLKLMTDFIFIFPSVSEFRMHRVLLFLPLFEIYFALYVIITSFMLLTGRRVTWKKQRI